MTGRQYLLIRSSTLLANSSLILRSSSNVLPVAPGSGQSSALPSAPMGQRSKQPKVTTLEALATISPVTTRGVLSVRTMPTSLRRGRTFGLTAKAGLTPALSARHPGGALELKSSSERTLLNGFSTQTKRLEFVTGPRAFSNIMTALPGLRIRGSWRP